VLDANNPGLENGLYTTAILLHSRGALFALFEENGGLDNVKYNLDQC
jgi:hypothetical protein